VLPSGGAPCSSGVNLLPELTPVRLRIVGRAQVSEACERGDRGEVRVARRSAARCLCLLAHQHTGVFILRHCCCCRYCPRCRSHFRCLHRYFRPSTAGNFSAYSRSLLLIPLLLGQGRTATIFLNIVVRE
jgi:hypothetical protein